MTSDIISQFPGGGSSLESHQENPPQREWKSLLAKLTMQTPTSRLPLVIPLPLEVEFLAHIHKYLQGLEIKPTNVYADGEYYYLTVAAKVSVLKKVIQYISKRGSP